MKRILVLAAAVLVLGPISPGAADSQPRVNNDLFRTFASCGNAKPYKPAKRCRYDSRSRFRGTFVFHSKVGKMKIRACFKILGRAPLGGGHACAKAGPLKTKAYPFKVAGVRQRFTVKFSWFVKTPDSTGPYSRAATSMLKVRP